MMGLTENLAVWVADIGSVPNHKFGWCGGNHEHKHKCAGGDIVEFADGIAQHLSAGMKVALGFECPLFVPVPDRQNDLGKKRSFERNRPWSAGAGSSALTTGLVQCAWILNRLKGCTDVVAPTFSWDTFTNSSSNLFIWEAMVTGNAKGRDHLDDAKIAVTRFWESYPDIGEAEAKTSGPVYSLAGAALLWSGVSSDPAWLTKPCVVLAAQPSSLR